MARLLYCLLCVFVLKSGCDGNRPNGINPQTMESYMKLVLELVSRVTVLEDKLQESKAAENRLMQDVEKLQTVNGQQENQIRNLESEIKIMRARGENRFWGGKHDNLTHDTNSQLETGLKKNAVDRENSVKQVFGNGKQLTDLPLTQRKRFVLSETDLGVAFSAYLKQDLNNLSPNQPILFNEVLLNDGGAYNIHTGAFTCPTKGVYLFSFFIDTRDVSQIWVKLVVNSNNVVDGIADGFHQSQDMQGGNLAILKLYQGDIVMVQVMGGTHLEGNDDTDFKATTFSGALLYSV